MHVLSTRNKVWRVWVLLMALMALMASHVHAFFRDSRPLFENSFHVRILDQENFDENVRNHTEDVWLVDFYAPWCPHCREFAPELEKVAAFYADSKNVHVGAVDCTKNDALCDREEVMAYPAIKLFNVPPTAEKAKRLTGFGKRNLKGIVSWVEDLLAEFSMESGIKADNIDQQIELMRNERVADDANGPGGYQEQALVMKYARLQDAGSAAIFTLENALFMGKNVLDGERYDAALQWVQAVAATFPLEKNRIAFAELAEIMQRREAWEQTAWKSMLAKWKFHAEQTTFPKTLLTGGEEQGWLHCNTYTCGLWTLFHSMSVNAEPSITTVKPSEVAAAIRLFVMHFFGCAECVQHFLRANPITVIEELGRHDRHGAQQLVIWLWKMHNKVNRVTKKKFWPTLKQCPICFADNAITESLDPAVLREDEITAYVQSVYSHSEKDIQLMVYQFGGVRAFLSSSVESISPQILMVFGLLVCCAGLHSQRHRFGFTRTHKHAA